MMAAVEPGFDSLDTDIGNSSPIEKPSHVDMLKNGKDYLDKATHFN